MSNHTTKETIQQFQSIFAELGIPKHIHCDRGANYTSIEFQRFCEGLSVRLSFSSSEHHSSNYAERSVQVVKGFMKKSDEWPICLLEHLSNSCKREQLGDYYQLNKKKQIKMTMKHIKPEGLSRVNTKLVYHCPVLPEGSNVLFHSDRDQAWLPGILVQRLHDRSHVIISEKGRKVIRNRIDIKPYHKEVKVNFQSSPKSTYQKANTNNNIHKDIITIPTDRQNCPTYPSSYFTPEASRLTKTKQ